MDNADPSISLRALDMSFKLDNAYPPQRSVNLDLRAKDFHPVDLSKYRNPPVVQPANDAGELDQDVIDAEVVE